MLRWLNDAQSPLRVTSYFIAREDALARIAKVRQIKSCLYLSCSAQLKTWEAVFDGFGVSSLDDLEEADCLILDDCDVPEPAVLAELVRTLLHHTRHPRLLLFGRRPLVDLFSDPDIAPLYQCVLGGTRLDASHIEDRMVLYVEVFGQGRVFANGQVVEQWTGPQALETFFVMLDLMPAPTDMLLMTLFGEISDDTYSRFHVSKTYINRALGQDFTMLGWGAQPRQQAYYLSDKISLYSDLHVYTKLIRQMLNEDSDSETVLHAAQALARLPFGGYVNQIKTSHHLEQRRQQMRYYLSQALVYLGRRLWSRGDTAQAEAMLTRAAIVDRTNPDVIDTLMALYRQTGDMESARTVYQRWQSQNTTGV